MAFRGWLLAKLSAVNSRFAFALTAAAALIPAACASHRHASANKPLEHVRPSVRLDAIHRAQVWEATDVASMDLRTGPKGHGAFAPEETVRCKYLQKVMSGNSPKFTCVLPPDDEMKVKFGRENGEVYAEVAATRLFWALGFRPTGCRSGCSASCRPKQTSDDASSIVFDPASTERKLKGQAIETSLTRVGMARARFGRSGGRRRAAPARRTEAAVFIQHTASRRSEASLPGREGEPPAGQSPPAAPTRS